MENSYSSAERAGLYIHIPFCKSKCPYCDFYSVRYDPVLAQSYVDRLIFEMKKYHGSFDTVYFGGGTPSILEAGLIGRIINEAKKCFDIADNAEITVECNPSKNLEKDFEEYAEYGVNRISIGMQSAKKEERLALGRTAGREQIERTILSARKAGIENISLDVMLGTPKQSLETLDCTFEFIDKMNVSHISAYMLKIEEGTRFYDMQSRLSLPDDDEVGDMYLKTVNALSSIGFNQYEISNFAKPGCESRHNLKYWRLADYLGIGLTAHSFWCGERFYYNRDFEKISDGTGGGVDERIMLGLRLNEGIDKSLLKNDGYKKFVDMNLINETDKKISLTQQGMLVSNVIIGELL